MKLERYKDKKETRKKVILISLTVLTIVSITMMLYKTFAKFTTSTSFSIMIGKVKYKKKGLEFGKDIIPSQDSEGGLYKVEHPNANYGWNQAEYRYAGSNPNNYVTFNDELWRIIGLVNVKTSNGSIEQRIKIMRNKAIGSYVINTFNGDFSDWTKSALKNMLNGIYYESKSGSCYYMQFSTKQESCDFTSNQEIHGLNDNAKNMLDKDVTWNMGYISNNGPYKSEDVYKAERSSSSLISDPQEWSLNNDLSYHNGVGLSSITDYLYGVGGEVREQCLNLGSFNEANLMNECYKNSFVSKSPGAMYIWLLSHYSNGMAILSLTTAIGSVNYPMGASAVPSIYLNERTRITAGEGTENKPYELTLE